MIRETGKWSVKYDKWDVLLCQVPNAPQVKKTSSGNFKVGLIWPSEENVGGPWISAFFSREEDAENVANHPNAFVIIVGRLREREYLGGTTFSVNVAGYKILEEEAPAPEPRRPGPEPEEVAVFEEM